MKKEKPEILSSPPLPLSKPSQNQLGQFRPLLHFNKEEYVMEEVMGE